MRLSEDILTAELASHTQSALQPRGVPMEQFPIVDGMGDEWQRQEALVLHLRLRSLRG